MNTLKQQPNQQPGTKPGQVKKPKIYSLYQSPGVNVCKSAEKPMELYLKGEDIHVDVECNWGFLPQWDVESNSPLGKRDPLVVFVETGEFLPGIPSFRDWDGVKQGVFTCPAEFAQIFGKQVIWICGSSDIKKIRKSGAGYRTVAQIVVRDLTQGQSKFRRTLNRLVEMVKMALPLFALAT